MLTSFTLLGGHMLVAFRAWQSAQEPWAGHGGGGESGQYRFIYAANPKKVAWNQKQAGV